MANRSELVKHASSRLGTVVKEEHDPQIDGRTVLGCLDDRCLAIGVVVYKVAQSCQHLGCLVGCEDVVAAPDLVVLTVCLQRVSCDDAEVVSSTFNEA